MMVLGGGGDILLWSDKEGTLEVLTFVCFYGVGFGG